jgi:hypothetical protein
MLESYLASLLGLPSSVMLLQNDRGIAKQYCLKYTFGNNEWLILEVYTTITWCIQLKCNFIQNGGYEILSTWKDH